MTATQPQILTDKFGRVHDYLRISLTDQCNLRCSYCMPVNPVFMPKDRLMSASEIELLASTFVQLGIKKIRLTGGEPLFRKDFDDILKRLARLNVPINITTNGYYLNEHINLIKKNIHSVNISLDTLKPEKFRLITQRNAFERTLENIDLALSHNIRTKINVVLVKNINDEEIPDFIRLTLRYPVEVRFIEFMPFKGNKWQLEQTFSRNEILDRIRNSFIIEPLIGEKHQTSEDFRVIHAHGTFGIISTVTKPFCDSCNRIRITADGKLKNCLFGLDEFDLRPYLKDAVALEQIIRKGILQKHRQYGGHPPMNIPKAEKYTYADNRTMTAIGG